MATKIQVRRDSAADWNITNPTLSEGEIGYETDTGKFKIGNGSSLWSALDYFLDSSGLASTYQLKDAELTALSALTSAADRLPYFTGSGSASLATFTTFGRSLVDDADASTARTTLGLGTMATETAASYLTTSSASTTYLPLASASSTYLTQTSASTTYLPLASASSTYLTQTSASTTYLTQTSASTTYLTQSSASATYAPIGGSSTPPAYVPFVSGGFYKSPGANGNGFIANQNSTYFGHFYVGATTSFDRIGCTAGTLTSSGNARLGIYTDSGGKPGTLVLDAGTVAYSTTNTAYLITINQSLTPGWYWLAFNAQSGTSQWFGSGGSQTSIQGVQRMGSTSVFTSMISGYEQSSVTGAFPASASAAFAISNGIPSAYLRAT